MRTEEGIGLNSRITEYSRRAGQGETYKPEWEVAGVLTGGKSGEWVLEGKRTFIKEGVNSWENIAKRWVKD